MKKLSLIVGSLFFIIMIALSGCSSLGSSSYEIIFDDVHSLSMNEYVYIEFELNRTAEVNVRFEVTSGHSVEGFMVDEIDFQKYINITNNPLSNDESLNSFQDFRISNESVSNLTGTLNAGTYYYIIDNTISFNTFPTNLFTDAVVNILIQAK